MIIIANFKRVAWHLDWLGPIWKFRLSAEEFSQLFYTIHQKFELPISELVGWFKEFPEQQLSGWFDWFGHWDSQFGIIQGI